MPTGSAVSGAQWPDDADHAPWHRFLPSEAEERTLRIRLRILSQSRCVGKVILGKNWVFHQEIDRIGIDDRPSTDVELIKGN